MRMCAHVCGLGTFMQSLQIYELYRYDLVPCFRVSEYHWRVLPTIAANKIGINHSK